MQTVWNNPDIIRHIYSFGDGHRERMKQVFEDIKVDPSNFMTRMKKRIGHRTVDLYLMDEYSYKEKRLLTTFFGSCFCCSRHSHYRRDLYKPPIPVPESKVKECDCRCREMYRRLSRLCIGHDVRLRLEQEYGSDIHR
jgi:hypothetical protein